jgi:hypothetical protein
MPLPMVHLAIAIRLNAGRIPAPDTLLGCLAPDAIHMRPGTTRADKNVTHLIADENTPVQAGQVLRFWQERLREAPRQAEFIAGYCAHLLADSLWVQQMARPFQAGAPSGMSRQELRSLYYQETDQVDFNLYHRMPWRQSVWQGLASALPPEFHPYLSAGEIGQWQQRTLTWFGGLKQEPRIVPVFFTDERVAAFIDQAADKIQDTMSR